MNVLSLFDGMSCGQQALERAGIKVNQYFASEIDKFAIKVTMANYPNTIQLGSVVNVNGYDLPKIDLLIGGSPCQSFSFAGKRKGMATKDEIEIHTLEHYLQLKNDGYEFVGQSYLFWEFMRILNQVKPKYFLLENVMMGEKWERILSRAIGVNPIEINSALVSAQNRRRLYWTNIGMKPAGLFGDLESIIKQPKDMGILLKDILETEKNSFYYLNQRTINYVTNIERLKNRFTQINGEKSLCLTAKGITNNTGTFILNIENKYQITESRYNYYVRRQKAGFVNFIVKNINQKSECLVSTMYKHMKGFCVYKNNLLNYNFQYQKIRRLTPIECERLQTVKDNYTNHVSDSQRYKMLGNGWTVDVISHIFKYLQ
jgi:DNA (cytosine-5)-methyltransferase 3A